MFRNFNFQDIFGKEYRKFYRPLNVTIYQPYREMISCFLTASNTEGPLEQRQNTSVNYQFYYYCLVEEQVNALYFLFKMSLYISSSQLLYLRFPLRILYEVRHIQAIFEIFFFLEDAFI